MDKRINNKSDNEPRKLEQILKSLEEARFHGSITVHYTSGKPRKIEYKKVEDID